AAKVVTLNNVITPNVNDFFNFIVLPPKIIQSVFSEKSEFNNYLLLWNISYIFHIKIASQNVNFF
ncbi:hypothetical protein, partial [Enterococcus faecalis]